MSGQLKKGVFNPKGMSLFAPEGDQALSQSGAVVPGKLSHTIILPLVDGPQRTVPYGADHASRSPLRRSAGPQPILPIPFSEDLNPGETLLLYKLYSAEHSVDESFAEVHSRPIYTADLSVSACHWSRACVNNYL